MEYLYAQHLNTLNIIQSTIIQTANPCLKYTSSFVYKCISQYVKIHREYMHVYFIQQFMKSDNFQLAGSIYIVGRFYT